MYQDRLDDFGVDEVVKLLTNCANRANNEHLILLCYEDLTKPGLRCHRQIFAAWYEENFGEVVSELEPDLSQNRLFE
jgi:hypothetical protein